MIQVMKKFVPTKVIQHHKRPCSALRCAARNRLLRRALHPVRGCRFGVSRRRRSFAVAPEPLVLLRQGVQNALARAVPCRLATDPQQGHGVRELTRLYGEQHAHNLAQQSTLNCQPCYHAQRETRGRGPSRACMQMVEQMVLKSPLAAH